MTTRCVVWTLAVLVGCSIIASQAVGLERRKVLALRVTITDEHEERDFGTVAAFLGRLQRTGRVCRFSDYEHGLNIDCGDPKAPDVLIGLDFAPSLGPELAELGSLRIHGIDGGEVPAQGRAHALENLLRAAGNAPMSHRSNR